MTSWCIVCELAKNSSIKEHRRIFDGLRGWSEAAAEQAMPDGRFRLPHDLTLLVEKVPEALERG